MSDLAVVRSDESQWTQVDTESTEQFIAEKHIGERIRRLRLKKSMGLVELGRHTGLSASFLSQLETGRVVPTLRNLARIAMVFSKDLSFFFETEPQTIFRIHRRKERVRLPQSGVETPAYFFESLGYMVPDRHMDPYFAEFVPLEAGQEPRAHMSSFMCWVASWGCATVRKTACWRQATRCTLTLRQSTPITARAKSRLRRSL
jgi:transcriptional regulator with XRE-family HTH domain